MPAILINISDEVAMMLDEIIAKRTAAQSARSKELSSGSVLSASERQQMASLARSGGAAAANSFAKEIERSRKVDGRRERITRTSVLTEFAKVGCYLEMTGALPPEKPQAAPLPARHPNGRLIRAHKPLPTPDPPAAAKPGRGANGRFASKAKEQ